ncbi:uncharacterized protein SPAPADRAFT_61284 [Spathaspora passalidarum NRRL Y-27907]|uniref:Zn(2)-C6 fungal-type domain-containing protein n=1 Tax=Spathaspora passalidarum (strain NRRL Y-27907 / 11-Y1) TaxID=619300 RepID=G3APN1_SPAPN|nr:uncharacterized protein SPAPADRAFT_61284 [Spathaspora passalidarum NRRL Y-27907]EGW32202.1 hypothetical protein SPAPADRAFT_61284 [Spathaspora passalidarum NRRL Y-27907]
MFSVLDAKSLSKTKRKNPSLKPEYLIAAKDEKNGFEQKPIKLNNIVKTRFRSKDGCLNCRKRRKKCDETMPICYACQYRHLECTWPKHVQERMSESPSVDSTK